VVDALLASGHDPVIFDLVPSPYHSLAVVATVIGTILDLDAVRRAAAGCDAVVHLAAVADVNDVARDPATAELVNTRGTEVVLAAAAAAAVPRVVYGSTVWVYGQRCGVLLDEGAPLPAPAHHYTATKLAGEDWCRASTARHGIEHTILRFGIPHGPRARGTTVVAAFVARARAGHALMINGDGSQSRQFVYVEDLAAGVVAALAPVAAGRTYNLVGQERVSVREIADVVRELVADVPIVHVAARANDLQRTDVSASRANLELGWYARTAFVDGVRRYVEWLTATNGSPSATTASMIDGNAAAVRRHDAGAL